MRQVRVSATWKSTQTLEVPDDHPKIGSEDLRGVLDASGDDIDTSGAELTDWEIRDPGPQS